MLQQVVDQVLQSYGCAAKNLVLAFSGGVDSVVLAHLLLSSAQCPRDNLRLVHVNHNLQPGALAWQDFAIQFAQQYALDIAIESVQVVTPNDDTNLEARARQLRYAALQKYIVSAQHALLTAHHLHDQIETFCLNAVRGAGVDGLAAMPVARSFQAGMLLRPLLTVARDEIVRYAMQQQLSWVEDHSNADVKFARNFVRHNLLLPLVKRMPRALTALRQTVEHCQAARELCLDLAAIDWQHCNAGTNKLDLQKLRQLSANRQVNLLRYFIQRAQYTIPSRNKVDNILQTFLTAQCDKNPSFYHEQYELHRYQDVLYLIARLPPLDKDVQLPVTVAELHAGLAQAIAVPWLGATVTLQPQLGAGISIARLVDRNVTLRVRQGGETVQLSGQKHAKTVKNLCQVARIPPWLRARLPLLYVNEELAAVAGIAIAADFESESTERGVALLWT